MTSPKLALCLLALPLTAETLAIVNARVLPVSGAPIERGIVVIQDGKIFAVGVKVAVPKDARRIDGTGLTVFPGMVDAYTAVGLADISSVKGSVDTTELGPFNPQAQAWIAVNPHSEMLRTARVNGITSAAVAPQGGLVSGTAGVVNLSGKYPDQMLLRRSGVIVNIPSMNRRPERNIESVTRGDAESAEARRQRVAADLAKLKQFLRDAKGYAAVKSPTVRDAALEAMIPVMRGEAPAICPADHFRDIRAAVELGDEFGLRVIIAGGADASKVVDLLKEKNVPVLFGAIQSLPRIREDAYDIEFSTPEALRRAGVRFAIVSGAQGGGSESRNLPYMAGIAAAFGLEREDAQKAITLWPAEILGLADRVGSIEPGKLANLVVIKGDPLDLRSEVKYVFVEGKPVPLESRNSELYEKFVTR